MFCIDFERRKDFLEGSIVLLSEELEKSIPSRFAVFEGSHRDWHKTQRHMLHLVASYQTGTRERARILRSYNAFERLGKSLGFTNVPRDPSFTTLERFGQSLGLTSTQWTEDDCSNPRCPSPLAREARLMCDDCLKSAYCSHRCQEM